MRAAKYAGLMLAFSAPLRSSGPVVGTEFAELRRCMAQAAKDDRFSGVLAAARRGKILSSMAFGHPDPAGREAMTLDTRFNIASAGKMFTAVAVGQLVEARRLRFDEPIGEILPGLSGDIAAITIDQLLTHRSGLGDYLRPENRDQIRAAKTATDLLPLAIKGGPAFKPGSRQQYSNSGYIVLGAIIETLSGRTYFDYVRDHIFVPTGMSTADLGGELPRATPLTKRSPDGSVSTLAHPAPVIGGSRASPAGGATATALDMIRFGEALRTGKILRRSTLDQLWTGRVPGRSLEDGRLSYAYGFARTDFPTGRWLVGHNGGSLGINAEFQLFPDEGYSIVALSNYDPPSATNAIAMARRAVLGKAPCPLKE